MPESPRRVDCTQSRPIFLRRSPEQVADRTDESVGNCCGVERLDAAILATHLVIGTFKIDAVRSTMRLHVRNIVERKLEVMRSDRAAVHSADLWSHRQA